MAMKEANVREKYAKPNAKGFLDWEIQIWIFEIRIWISQ